MLLRTTWEFRFAQLPVASHYAVPDLHQVTSSCTARTRTRLHADAQAAERAGFEPAEEREPLAGLANRCLGPLDYLSKAAFYRVEIERATAFQVRRRQSGGGGIRTRETLRACRFSRPVVSSAHPPLRIPIIPGDAGRPGFASRLRDRSTAEKAVSVVQDGQLPRGDRALRLIERELKALA